jgi:hypothetical protein
MDMNYLICPNKNTCKQLSESLYRLARPQHRWEPQETATYMLAWIRHPVQDVWALMFPAQFGYSKHPDINGMLTSPTDQYGSQAMMQSLFLPIAANGVSSLQALLTYILTHDVIDTAMILPHVNPSLVKTKAEMEADGWFPAPVMP